MSIILISSIVSALCDTVVLSSATTFDIVVVAVVAVVAVVVMDATKSPKLFGNILGGGSIKKESESDIWQIVDIYSYK